MTLQSSGAISLSDVNVELGRSSTATICMNCSSVRCLFGVSSGAISMSSGYGKSSIPKGSGTYTAPGCYTFVVPQKTTRLSALAISGGSAGSKPYSYFYPCYSIGTWTYYPYAGYVTGGTGGYGGGISYRNNFSVATGQNLTVRVGACQGSSGGQGNYSMVNASGATNGYPVYAATNTCFPLFYSGTSASTYTSSGKQAGCGSSKQAGGTARGITPWVGIGGGGGGVAGSSCAGYFVCGYCSYNGFYQYYQPCHSYGAGGSVMGKGCGSFSQYTGNCSQWVCFYYSGGYGGYPLYGKHGYGRNGGSAGGSAPNKADGRWSGCYCYYTGYKPGSGPGGGGGSNATYGFNNSGSYNPPGAGPCVYCNGHGGGGGSGGSGGGNGSYSVGGNGGGYGGGGAGASAALSPCNPYYNYTAGTYLYGNSNCVCFYNNRGIHFGVGASGTVRIVYPGCTRSYPSTNVGCP